MTPGFTLTMVSLQELLERSLPGSKTRPSQAGQGGGLTLSFNVYVCSAMPNSLRPHGL